MQQSNEVNIETEYLTYNGMNRAALILGMPMLPLFFILIFFFALVMFSMSVLGNKA